jgi:hypothetical protein
MADPDFAYNLPFFGQPIGRAGLALSRRRGFNVPPVSACEWLSAPEHRANHV